MNKKITPYLFAFAAAGVTVLLSATISLIALPQNKRSDLPVPTNKQDADAMANALMESKCAACHGTNPEYNRIVNLLALGQLKRDIDGAQRSFRMGGSPLRSGNVDYLKMDYVLRTRRMPPTQYSMVHLGSRLTPDDVKILRHRYTKAGAFARAFATISPAVVSPQEKDKVLLGHMLFFDPRLSTNNKISCASCHDLTKGGTDNLAKSEGVPGSDGKPQLGGVNAPSVYNAAGNIRQFWDGRAANLQEQAGGPPLNPVEMGYSKPEDWNAIANKLKQDAKLTELFAKVYGDQGITGDTITDAIAAFECTLVTPDSDFDRYLGENPYAIDKVDAAKRSTSSQCYLGGDSCAIDKEQEKGMFAFFNYGCATCHSGPSLGGLSFEYVNTHAKLRAHKPDYEESAFGHRDFTKNEAHRDMFRVPNLRNVALTAPYFHTGTVRTLDEAVRIMFETQTGCVPSNGTIRSVTRFLEAQTGCLNGTPLDKLKPEEVSIPGSTIPKQD